jgi:chemotaxis protein CheY-P-specific phosphatase CheC
MKNTTKQCFRQAIEEVLASMVSMTLRDAYAQDLPQIETSALNVRIEYQGEHSGEISIILGDDLASLIARRFLGMDDESDILDDMIEDSARELVNVICGHFVTMKYGEKPIMKISIPRLFSISPALFNILSTNEDISPFMVDDLPMLGLVRLK